jgi:hypothetical protein
MPYRGKYPNKIKAVGSCDGGVFVTVNIGKRYVVKPLTKWASDHAPFVGAFLQDIALSDQYLIIPVSE